jgi:hypothetical protein
VGWFLGSAGSAVSSSRPATSLLGISIAAMLAGANDLIAIFRWGRRLKPEALRLFGIDSG